MVRDRPILLDRETIGPDCAGIYSNSLRHAEKAVEDCGAKTRAAQTVFEQRKMAGDQDELIVDVPLDTRERQETA